ncbi:MAG: TRAP transporter substrate-binding protein [Hyphomicrobiaceae bacterium]
MMRKLTGLLAATVVIAGASAVAAQAKTLKLQASQNSGDFTYKYLTEKWAPKVEEMSGGSLKLEILPTKAVVPHREALKAVAAGILDGDLNAVSYYAGLDPAYGMLGDLIAAYSDADQPQMFCMNAGGKEVLQKLHDKYTGNKVHVVGCGNYTNEALVAKKPIRNVAEFQGVKIRSPEGLAAEVFRSVGAAPVAIPFSEVYTSLEKGVVDAADASAYINNYETGLNKVAPYPIYPGIHSMAVLEFIVNNNVWKKLSKAQQTILETWYIAAYSDLRRYADIRDRQQVAIDREGKGDVKEIISWTDEERAKFRQAAMKAWAEYAKKSPLAQEVYNTQMKFLKMYGLVK